MTTDFAAAAREAISRAAPPGALTEIETHVSHVFLTAERAYKLKKAVSFPFLDAATAGRRHQLCDDEIRLNRRLAADLYLDVRAIVATPTGSELAEPGHPDAIDFLIEMRRYDENTTMASRLARAALRSDDVAAVGGALAAFHSSAREIRSERAEPAAIERRLLENTHELLALVDQRAEVGRILTLQRFIHTFVTGHLGLLDARAREGRVREGHGDLRAEHVLIDDRIRIVDCLEFDKGLREIDVADDLSFLLMDLVSIGGERHAKQLIRAYRSAGGDPGDDALLAFYASQHALVRSKVALLRGAQHPYGSAAHGKASSDARDLLTLAERFAWQARLPLAIVVCGVPASGKSRLGELLAQVSGLALLNSDVTRKRLAGLTPRQRAGAEVYGEPYNALTYAELGRRAAREVGANGGVLVDASFRHRVDRETFATAFAASAPILFIECHAPRQVLAERARERDRDDTRVSDASIEIVQREATSWEPLDEVPADAHLTVRTDRPIEDVAADIVASLDQRLAGSGPFQR